jgi:hypothetical protein
MNDAHKNYCYCCEAYLETDWKYCAYCGKKRDRSATKLGGKQTDSVKKKISRSIKEMWQARKKVDDLPKDDSVSKEEVNTS